MTAKINTKQDFSDTRKGIVSASKTINTDVQAMFVFAFAQYANHGRTTYLTSLRKMAITCKSIPALEVEKYTERYANVKWDGKAFKSQAKTKDVSPLTTKWFDGINKSADAPEPKKTDILKMVKALAKQIDKKSENNLLNDNAKQVEKAEEMLATLVSSLEALGFNTTAK